MRKTIVVPIDFSEASQNAYLYATKVARVTGSSIALLHVIDDSIEEDTELLEAQYQELEYYMNTFASLHTKQQYSGVAIGLNVKTVIERGEVLTTILRYAQHPSNSMVIMGATGTHASVNNTLGRTAYAVAQQAESLVLLVPKTYRFLQLERILYVSDYESADEEIIKQIVCFSRKFYADLNFLHIDQHLTQPKDYQLIKKQLFKQLPYSGQKPSFKIGSAKNHSIIKGIEEYALRKDIDLIVLVNQERNYLDTIMKKSLAADIVEHIQLPVLVYHYVERENACDDTGNNQGYAGLLN
ncbi:MAG: universal stress protein [Bacteroidota bacterium]